MPGPGQGGGIHVDGEIITNGTELLRKTIETIETVVHWAMEGANKLTTFITMPLEDVLNGMTIGDNILETLVDILNLGNMSIMEIAIGIGMPTVIIWSIVKWLKL